MADGKAGALGNAHCIDRGTRLRRALLGATSLAALGLSSAGASAQTVNWTGTTSTDWFTGTNWSAGVPTFAVNAYIDTTSPNATVIGAAGAHADSIYVGTSGTATLTVQNGGTLGNTYGTIALGSTSTGTVTVDGSGSTWTNSSALYVGSSGAGTLTVRNGGSVSASSVTIAANAGSTGTLSIGAGIGDLATAPGTLSTPIVAFGAGAGQIVFNHTATNYVFAPIISGAGAMRVEAGKTILTRAGSSVGAVTVNGGELEFGQSGTFTAVSYTTQSGASTSIDRNAQLAVTGAFTQSAGSTLNVAIGANDPAITAATASLAGTLNVSGYAGTQYTVIHTTNGITGDFANVSIGGSSSPVDYLTVMGGISGNDYNIYTDLTWNAGPAQGNGVFTLTNRR